MFVFKVQFYGSLALLSMLSSYGFAASDTPLHSDEKAITLMISSSLPDGEADEREVRVMSIYSRHFNRENYNNLVLPDAPSRPGLFDDLTRHPRRVLRQVRNNQTSRNRALLTMHEKTPKISRSDYQMRHAAMDFDEDYRTRVTGGEIIRHIEKDAGKAISKMIVNNLDLYKHFNAGISFDLNLGSLWSRSSSKPKKTSQPRDLVRYGLVLEGIEYRKSNVTLAATTSMEDSLRYATKARPIWTIKELQDNSRRNPFQVYVPPPRHYLDRANDLEETSELDIHDEMYLEHHGLMEDRSIWSRIDMPELKFSGKARPRRGADVGDLASGSTGLPGMQIQLNQSQGYYSLSYLTNSKMRKDRITHQFAMPVHGTLVLKRIYDENFKEQETIAENILIDDSLPRLTVRQLHTNDTYRAGLRHYHHNHSLTVSAETASGWRPSSGLFKHDGEKYRMDYSFRF